MSKKKRHFKFHWTTKNIAITVLLILFSSLRLYNRQENTEKLFNIENKSKEQNISENNENNNTDSYNAFVNRVIDGDTIEVIFYENTPPECKYKEKIRFVGVNTPELNLHKKEPEEYFAHEAYDFTNSELYKQFISLKFDDISSKKDRYDRLLCYVYVDDYCFNKILIEQGYGKYYSNFKFNKDNMNNFKKAEEYAKKNRLGMWNNVR